MKKILLIVAILIVVTYIYISARYSFIDKRQTIVDFHEMKYEEVLSEKTKMTWLDKNIVSLDSCVLGDCQSALFQWGRSYDGHQELSSKIRYKYTGFNGLDDFERTVYSDNFIINADVETDWTENIADYNGRIREDFLLSHTNNIKRVCPIGYKLPTQSELKEEVNKSGIEFFDFAYEGFRDSKSGKVLRKGKTSCIWTASTNGNSSVALYISIDYGHGFYNIDRAEGCAVRCMKFD